jgi:hypothetical protein
MVITIQSGPSGQLERAQSRLARAGNRSEPLVQSVHAPSPPQCVSRESGIGSLYAPSSQETAVHARVFVYVPHRCRSFDCLHNLDHSCARGFGGHTAIERISSVRGPMNRTTPKGPYAPSEFGFEIRQKRSAIYAVSDFGMVSIPPIAPLLTGGRCRTLGGAPRTEWRPRFAATECGAT